MSRSRLIPAGLALFAFAVALWQRPGTLSFDTKAQLHLAPGRFLSDVASVWTPTTDLGHVWSGQYVGYLFPMGPFFALGHAVGLPDWLIHRLWLGAILAVAAWGAVRLLDALLPDPRGLPHLAAGAVLVLNPYVAVLANRASVTLVAYALLPWLLLAVHRGVRTPRSWWWPAAAALLVAAAAGGVNAAVVAWVAVGPLLLLLYEPLLGHVPWRASWDFAWRAVLLGAVASLWWLVPLAIQSSFGNDFLQFVEQPGTVWGTTAAGEALRLMAYWHSYTGVGLAGRPLPLIDTSPPLLFSAPVVLASLVLPAAALAGFVWTRRWRYGPFALGLVLVGALIVMAGFPEGTPLRRGLYFVYNHVGAVDFLRTSQKAAPLIVVGLALLIAGAIAELRRRRPGAAAAALIAGAVLVVLAASAWPLTRGHGVGLTSDGVPPAWRAVARDVDRRLPANSRALVLPGQLFGFYKWGGVGDPILPAISRRPVAVRAIVPYADLHAMDALWTVDRLVGQQRLYPGELRPLLALLGVRSVITATDDDRDRSGGPDPVRAADQLAGQGLAAPARSYGPLLRFPAPPDGIEGAALPQVRRYDLPRARPIVRVEPRGPVTIVDGAAEALGELAAFGALPAGLPVRYAADMAPAELRGEAFRGADVVITDTNRRRVFANSRPRQNLGPTLTATDPISENAALLDPFGGNRLAAQAVRVERGARYVRAPYSPELSLFPEHGPSAAFDGDPRTAWIADRALEPTRRWIEIGFDRPRDVPYVDVTAADDQRGVVTQVEIAGRKFSLRSGRNRIRLGLHAADSLRVRVAHVRYPPDLNGGAGGFSEIAIPGVRVRESIRLPTAAEDALRGGELRRTSLTYLFARTTGDDPLHRSRAHGPWQASSIRDRGDGETGLRREFSPPAARRWSADAWLSLSPEAPDPLLDRLAGYGGPVVARSSGRFENQGRFRASSAFDGTASRAWVGEKVGGNRPWIAWRLPSPRRLRRLELVAPRLPVATPSVVRLRWSGGATPPLRVSRSGDVMLPAPVRSRDFRLEVLRVRRPHLRNRAAAAHLRLRRAVGIGEIRGAGVPRLTMRRAGPVRTDCGAVRFRVGGRRVALRVDTDVRTLDRGGALLANSCGAPVALRAGHTFLAVGDGPFRVDQLRLRSGAPEGMPPPRGGGRVLAPGKVNRASVDGAEVALRGPSWLVLGQSYDRGWRASCDGRSLGEPVVIDAFANGWRANPGCHDVRFWFAPQTAALWLGIGSGLACLLIALGLVIYRRPEPEAAGAPLGPLPPGDRPARWPLGRAVLAGLAVAVVLGFLLAIRAGVVIAPAAAFALWRGVGARVMAIAAGILLAVAVPAVYLLHEPPNHGGYDFNFAVDLIAAHWLAVAAIVLLIGALVRTVAAARRSSLSPDS